MKYIDYTNKRDIPEIPPAVAVCPICGAQLFIADIDEYEEDTRRVTESGFHINCSTEPEIDSPEWWPWFNHHWSMPYVDWLPVEQIVYKWFDANYRLTKFTRLEELDRLAEWEAASRETQ